MTDICKPPLPRLFHLALTASGQRSAFSPTSAPPLATTHTRTPSILPTVLLADLSTSSQRPAQCPAALSDPSGPNSVPLSSAAHFRAHLDRISSRLLRPPSGCITVCLYYCPRPLLAACQCLRALYVKSITTLRGTLSSSSPCNAYHALPPSIRHPVAHLTGRRDSSKLPSPIMCVTDARV